MDRIARRRVPALAAGSSRSSGTGAGRFPPCAAIAELPGGEIWFAEDDGAAPLLERPVHELRNGLGSVRHRVSSSLPTAPAASGSARASGLFRFDAGRALSFPLNPTDPDKESARSTRIAPAPSGSGRCPDVYGLRDGRLVQFTTANGLASDGILRALRRPRGQPLDRNERRRPEPAEGPAHRQLHDPRRPHRQQDLDRLRGLRPESVGRDRQRKSLAHEARREPVRGGARVSENRITTMAEDASGNLWARNARPRRSSGWTAATWKAFGLAEGLPALSVWSICSDARRSRLDRRHRRRPRPLRRTER